MTDSRKLPEHFFSDGDQFIWFFDEFVGQAIKMTVKKPKSFRVNTRPSLQQIEYFLSEQGGAVVGVPKIGNFQGGGDRTRH